MTLQTRGRTPTLSSLQRVAFEAVAYADVFDFAVTAEEVRRALPMAVSPVEVEAALAGDSALGGLVSEIDGYFVLAGCEGLVGLRRRRAADSAALMRCAESWGSWIARLPFVRMVAVTGSLAVDNADPGDDIDYLVVTAKGRLWLARALTMVCVRLARLRGLTLCPNYLLSETALALSERDAYTARELLQMRPLSGLEVYERMLAANPWCRESLPNWDSRMNDTPSRRSLLTGLGERLLGGRIGDALERRLLRRKAAELRAQADGNPEAVFDEDVCKGHFDAHRARLQSELSRRMRRLEVEP
jgi:hypothetical protein